MKATRLFLANIEEHERHEELGLNNKTKPEVETLGLPFYFKVDGVTSAFITTDNFISMTLFGEVILLKNEKRVWEKLVAHLE